MTVFQKVRLYWRLVFLLPMAVSIAAANNLARGKATEMDCLFAVPALVYFAVTFFRWAIACVPTEQRARWDLISGADF